MEIEEFSLELTRLTADANREFFKCKDLQAFLDEHAELLDKSYHTLAYATARSLANNVSGLHLKDDLRGYGSAAVVYREYQNVLAGLTGDDESPVIRLLAQRAALCWLHVQQAEQFHTMIHDRQSLRHDDVQLADRQLTAAQNRFLKACDALAKMRAMTLATEAMKEKLGKSGRPQLALVSGQAKGRGNATTR